MGAGIDYGNGVTNIDTETGIRYGVIPVNEVVQSWGDSSEPYYPKVCPECGGEIEEIFCDIKCPHCKKEITERDFEEWEADGWFVNDAAYKAHSDDHGDIFIVKSEYYTKCVFCSPCAPGAGYLKTPCDDGVKAYCFNHDWFDSGIAPYPVYSVKTNELIEPDQPEQEEEEQEKI